MILRRLAPVLAVFVLAGACTAGSPDKILVSPTSNPTANAGPALPVIPIAADPLCRGRSSSNPSSGGPSASLPASMAQIARQVEQIRNLTFLRSVSPHPVTSAQMAQLVRSGLRSQLSKADASRTSKAWGTIGAIPQGTDLGKAVSDLESSQVIGFYDY